MFQLTELKTKEPVTICDRFNTMEHSTIMPDAFTEQGVAMPSSNKGHSRGDRTTA
jgi:hypothetical protein